MSETEFLTGTLIKVGPNDGEELEAAALRILDSLGHKIGKWHDTFLECLEDDFYEKYSIVNGTIYLVEMKQKDPQDDIFEASKNEDGSISFTVKYYNGGCSFNEAIENSLQIMDQA